MSDPAYSLLITEEGLEAFHTTLLESIKLICETITTGVQSEGERSIQRAHIEAEAALAATKADAAGALALAKVEAEAALALAKAKQPLAKSA